MKFNLLPFNRTKQNTSKQWCFEYRPYGRVCKDIIKRRLKSIYPELKILKINIIKSLKRVLVVIRTDVSAPWQ